MSLSKSEGLMQPIQMQLSQNQKLFSKVFSAFPESTQNLEYLEREDEPQRPFLREIIDSKMWGYSNA